MTVSLLLKNQIALKQISKMINEDNGCANNFHYIIASFKYIDGDFIA
jgi:hypothetical protein